MARLTSLYRSRIVANVQETKNGEKAIAWHNRTEAWHAEHPVGRPVRTIGVAAIKAHENEQCDEDSHLWHIDVDDG